MALPLYYNVRVVPHVAALKGPVARQVPDATRGILRIHEWEWRPDQARG